MRSTRTIGIATAVVAVLGVLLGISSIAQAGPIVHTNDFIPDATRSHFNGFENIPHDAGSMFTGGNGPYTEDIIQVEQVNGDPGNDIYTGILGWTGFEGNRGWYANGGDFGYTEITLEGGLEFQNVGLNYGSGYIHPIEILYELLDNGSVVLSGSEPLTSCYGCGSNVNYLGFSGGGFDTIRLRDTTGGLGVSVTDGTYQALALDSIETESQTVPEPATLALFGAGLAGLGTFRLRRKAKTYTESQLTSFDAAVFGAPFSFVRPPAGSDEFVRDDVAPAV